MKIKLTVVQSISKCGSEEYGYRWYNLLLFEIVVQPLKNIYSILCSQQQLGIILLFYRNTTYSHNSMSKQADQLKVYSDTKLKLKYELLNRIGQGCFGTIYKAINRSSKRQVALKLEYHGSSEDSKSVGRSNISNEIVLLEKLRGVHGVPRLYGAGKWGHGYYMEIQLLSSSLHDEKNKMFNEGEIYAMASELIQILRDIHGKGILHQDLKPQNIMRNQKGALVVIDFGLSGLLQADNQDSSKKRGFVGTPRYASLAAHRGIPQRPQDDIESLLYVIGALYMKKAPWFELKGPASKRLEKIQKYKEANSGIWFKQCGQAFSSAYQYLRQMKQDEKVNYGYLIGLFQSARKAKALQTMKINPTSIPFQLSNLARRNSDNNQKLVPRTPTIAIHFVESPARTSTAHNGHKGAQINYRDDQHSEVSRSHNNFSQIAQDGYIELLQFLTEKIFNGSIEDGQDKQNEKDKDKDENRDKDKESAMVSQFSGREPVINNMAKYEVLHFKNPFYAASS